MIQVNSVHCYPIKGCKQAKNEDGKELTSITLGRLGGRYDHGWMIVDPRGMFVAQRTDKGLGVAIPAVCLIEPRIVGNELVIYIPGKQRLVLPVAGVPNSSRIPVQVWSQQFEADDQGEEAAQRLTDFLSPIRKGEYRLVRIPDDCSRPAKHGPGNVAAHDADKILVIGVSSLTDLCTRTPYPLLMDRFRPTITLKGCEPYAEDRMDLVRIGGKLVIIGGTLCKRCAGPCVDQETAEQGKSPTFELLQYRNVGKDVFFGRNFNYDWAGEDIVVSVEDEWEVLEWASETFL